MRNIWRNELRRPDPGPPPDGRPAAAGDPTPSEAVREDERRVLVRRAVDDLPDPTDREVVRMVFFEGLSFPETGRRVGLHESTVRYRLQRVLSALGAELEGLR
jgi:RNA polymerase sigma factor (sigma-70 family)